MLVPRFVHRWVVSGLVGAALVMVFFASKTVIPTPQAMESLSMQPVVQEAAPPNERQDSNGSVPTATPPHGNASEQTGNDDDCETLPRDHPLRLKLNGKRLPLRYDALEKELRKRLLSESKVLPLGDGRILASLDDTLYMLDQNRRVNWKYTSAEIRDFAFIASTGLIYGSAYDNIMFILDASTGQELYINGRNGKFAYGEAVPFGDDMCIITDYLAGYREALEEWETGRLERIEMDGIAAWRGTEIVWTLDFPPDAELVVRGDRIYAVTKTDKSIYVREIIPPKTNK